MLSCLGTLVSVAFIAVTLAFLVVAGRAAGIAKTWYGSLVHSEGFDYD